MPAPLDLTDQTVGKFTCLRVSGRTEEYGGCRVWECRCSCGAVEQVAQVKLMRGYDRCNACRAKNNPCVICGGPCPIGVGAKKICSELCRVEYARRKARASYERNKAKVIQRSQERSKRQRAAGDPVFRELDKRKWAKLKANRAAYEAKKAEARAWYAENRERILAERAAKREPLPPKQCPACNCEFAPTRRDAVYCSESCRRAKAEPLAAKKCTECSKSFVPQHSTRKTCSKDCRQVRLFRQHLARQETKRMAELQQATEQLGERTEAGGDQRISCKNCHELFLPFSTSSKSTRKKKRVFCSHSCRLEWRAKSTAERKCVICGVRFCGTKRGQVTCSPECRAERKRRRVLERLGGADTAGTESRTCERCGADFLGHKLAKYCSQACLLATKNEREKQRVNRAYRCKICGSDMSHLDLKIHRYTCSDQCRAEAYRQKLERNNSKRKKS